MHLHRHLAASPLHQAGSRHTAPEPLSPCPRLIAVACRYERHQCKGRGLRHGRRQRCAGPTSCRLSAVPNAGTKAWRCLRSVGASEHVLFGFGVVLPADHPCVILLRSDWKRRSPTAWAWASRSAALAREGDNFDYDKWLKRVRLEEAQAKKLEAASPSGELVAVEIGKPMGMPDGGAQPNPTLQFTIRSIRASRLRRRPNCQANTPKARLRAWLGKVHRAWDDFQTSRARDAVYDYLEAVFGIVMHYKIRRRTTRLLRHAFEFADLEFDKNADPFAAVIRCTSGNATGTKMISKWSRALRFAAATRKSRTTLKQFMRKLGGINACAGRYAELSRQG
jgi:hypothetical protein